MTPTAPPAGALHRSPLSTRPAAVGGALWPPPPVMGLGQLETDQKRLPQPAATFRHGIPSLSPALLQDKPRG
jgi:hypothetical protein